MILFLLCFSGSSAGHWSEDGCSPNEELSNENQTVCECVHLTNFAVLMSPFVEVNVYLRI